MPAANFDLNDESVIEQGSRWLLTLFYPGDVDKAAFRGQIRKTYGGDVLANFRFAALPYNEETDKTEIRVSLTSNETKKIPLPPSSEFWRYDVIMTPSGGDRVRLLQGRVYVSPGVTE